MDLVSDKYSSLWHYLTLKRTGRQGGCFNVPSDDRASHPGYLYCFCAYASYKISGDLASHFEQLHTHYSDVTMGQMESQITSLTIVYSTVYSGAEQRKLQSSVSLAFMWGIHRSPVNSPHKWPVMREMFPFDNATMGYRKVSWNCDSQRKWVGRYLYLCSQQWCIYPYPSGQFHWQWGNHILFLVPEK